MCSPRQQKRPGYTLMEMMLVLTIMVITAALAVPVIQSLLADNRQVAAGDQIRGRLADTRSKAMDEGRAWKLAYVANTGVLQLAPEDSDAWTQTYQDEVELPDLIRELLPHDIYFAASAEAILGQQQAGSPGSAWETIAVFMPAGNAQDDTVTYFGNMGFWPMRITVRALTGAVAVEMPDPQGSQP